MVAIQVTRTRLVQQDAKPLLIENIGNYQREMIYLSGGCIGEMQQVILKLYGATPRKGSADLDTRHSPEGGVLEQFYEKPYLRLTKSQVKPAVQGKADMLY